MKHHEAILVALDTQPSTSLVALDTQPSLRAVRQRPAKMVLLPIIHQPYGMAPGMGLDFAQI
jgi:hypothetical protein